VYGLRQDKGGETVPAREPFARADVWVRFERARPDQPPEKNEARAGVRILQRRLRGYPSARQKLPCSVAPERLRQAPT